MLITLILTVKDLTTHQMVINFTFKYANLCAYRAYNHTYLILKSIKLVELPADWVKRFAIHFNFNRERRDDFLELPKINE